MEVNSDFWRKCSSCKKPIAFGAQYYVCSVSTCNSQRTGLIFCSMPCFEVHLPSARHRDAGGIRKTAPAKGTESITAPANAAPQRRIIVSQTNSNVPSPSTQVPHDILIVASKLKDYIHAKSEMNTSASVMAVLSDIVRLACDEAIEQARRDGRKTVMDRDFKK